MRLSTPRLRLLPLSVRDLDWFHATNVDSFVRSFLWDDQAISIATAFDILHNNEHLQLTQGWGLWKIVHSETGEWIGYAGLWSFFGEQQPQLLYALLEEYSCEGFAFEACSRVIRHAFERLGFDYLDASMDTDNLDSIKLCQRLGLSFVRTEWVQGVPTHFYSIERDAPAVLGDEPEELCEELFF